MSGLPVVEDVSLSVAPGETLGLVGESGSGKTTIARCVAGLHVPASGRILLDGVPLAPRAQDRPREARRRRRIVASIADRVLVLDRGRVCEEGPTEQVFVSPRHSRSRELLEAAPRRVA